MKGSEFAFPKRTPKGHFHVELGDTSMALLVGKDLPLKRPSRIWFCRRRAGQCLGGRGCVRTSQYVFLALTTPFSSAVDSGLQRAAGQQLFPLARTNTITAGKQAAPCFIWGLSCVLLSAFLRGRDVERAGNGKREGAVCPLESSPRISNPQTPLSKHIDP